MRVLIVSHNPFSDTQSNGKTLSAFFNKWDKDNLSQLYFTTDVPDFSVCKNFFQINDFDILKRVINKDVDGRRVEYRDIPNISSYKNKIINNSLLNIIRKNNGPSFRFFRDILWTVAGFKTKSLIDFVEEVNPQVVFFQSSSGCFAFSIVKWICQSRKIPLIMQTTDDYVTGKFTLNPFFWIHLNSLKRAYKLAVAYANCVIAIGEKMAKEYEYRFGGNYHVAMNSIKDPYLPSYVPKKGKISFLYAGNLGLNRWKVLSLIALCLEELYLEDNLLGELSIYSLIEPDKAVLEHLNRKDFSKFKGKLNTKELNREKTFADILVHVESFDAKNKHVTRLSISTKIPEYLISGRCILAVGPPNVASIEYLQENDLATIVTSNNKCQIKKTIKRIMTERKERINYSQKGFMHARLFHNSELTAESIYNIISSAVSKKN